MNTFKSAPRSTGRSLKEILVEERNYWIGVVDTNSNRLLNRVAQSNINKRNLQIHKLQRNIPIT